VGGCHLQKSVKRCMKHLVVPFEVIQTLGMPSWRHSTACPLMGHHSGKTTAPQILAESRGHQTVQFYMPSWMQNHPGTELGHLVGVLVFENWLLSSLVIVALKCKIIWQPSHLMSTPKT